MRLVLDLNVEDHDVEYLQACARIRDVTPTSLVNNIVRVICQEQMVRAVLDDDSKPTAKRKGQHRYKGPQASFT